MTIEVTVGPPVLTINRSDTFMVTDFSGQIHPERAEGVFARDTRFVSSYRLRINGKPWRRASSAVVAYHAAQVYLVNPSVAGASAGGGVTVPYGTVGLRLARSVNREQVDELFTVINYAATAISIVLQVELASDFADVLEVKAGQLRQRANLVTHWDVQSAELSTTHQRSGFLRRLIYRIVRSDGAPSYANGLLAFPIDLPPNGSWSASAEMLLQTSASRPEARPAELQPKALDDRAAQLHRTWVESCTAIVSPNADLVQTYGQSINDMGALRLLESDLGEHAWVPAAGVPWYVALFGRDSLVASLQCMAVNPRFAGGALQTLAAHQARERDDIRDAQPGKILHELRHGELAYFHVVPFTPYYGTWDATPLYLLALHAAWRWTADRRLIEDLREAAERCLRWIDESGDLDGDGFQEYRTYSPKGFENMSWKDSADGVVYPDGANVPQPKALCELQGYVYAAWLAAAELFDALGDPARAGHLRARAADLKRHFNAVFWMEDEGTFAFALDPEKRQVKTVVSNAGHCLWTGIADDDKAARVVARLLAPDMWSGWGIRTLSAKLVAYNPNSYQRGSVWPHDSAIAAAGFKRYGFADQASQVARGILDAAAIFQSHRLPEVFAGLDRGVTGFPVQYRGANTPQAWAAGSVFHLVQTLLGLRADAPHRVLRVNPTLPDWLPSLELSRLDVGDARLGLRFWREGAKTRFTVLSREGGPLDVVVGGPAPLEGPL